MKTPLLLLLCTLAATPVFAGDLRIEMSGVSGSGGMIRIALFDGPADFPSTRAAITTTEVVAREGTVNAVFEGLRQGHYAVALYHDENGNKSLDTGLLGLPSEGYGFSRDARATFGPPKFTRAAFEVGESGTAILIGLRY